MSNRSLAVRHAFPLPDPVRDGGLVALAHASARRRGGTWARRSLRPTERGLMWLLRLYVLAMLAVVALQVFRLA